MSRYILSDAITSVELQMSMIDSGSLVKSISVTIVYIYCCLRQDEIRTLRKGHFGSLTLTGRH